MRTKKTTMTHRLGEIFLVKCQKQAFSFNKTEAKVYCYAVLHVLMRYMHKTYPKKNSCVPAWYARMPWLEPCLAMHGFQPQ
jgi:hypothetical protein